MTEVVIHYILALMFRIRDTIVGLTLTFDNTAYYMAVINADNCEELVWDMCINGLDQKKLCDASEYTSGLVTVVKRRRNG